MGNKSTKSRGEKQSPVKEKKKKPASKKPKQYRVLTLGIAGSGKTTFAKQMKILYCGGFDEEEVHNYKDILLKNTLLGMQELVKQVEKLELSVSDDNRKRARYFSELNLIDFQWTEEMGQRVRELWKDPAVQQAWARASEVQLQVSMLDYHIDRLDDYCSEDYVPTNDDIVRARQRTTGSSETIFTIEKREWVLIDAGGQKPERAKWESLLNDDIIAVIYFAALDEFNMMSVEDNKTKMQIALESFKEVVTSKSTEEKTILLFLNKSDIFEKKIKVKKDFEAFQSAFPKYSGGQNTDETSQYISKMFSNVAKDAGREEESLHVHVTCALDTNAMDTVFQAVRETLFFNKMQGLGM